jgi:hypothetical protein
MSTTDIVTRLRGHIAITTRLAFAKDGFPEPVYIHGPSPICQEAADEIERLRVELDRLGPLMLRASAEIQQVRAERDEARRMWCEAAPVGNSLSVNDMDRRARAEATRRGWDCFKEEGKP